jgi:hypothetical protein
MTVTTDHGPLAVVAEEELLTALMSRKEGSGEPIIEHPLLLAALMRRRRDRDEDDEPIIEHPLLLAALMRRPRRAFPSVAPRRRRFPADGQPRPARAACRARSVRPAASRVCPAGGSAGLSADQSRRRRLRGTRRRGSC